MGDETGVDTDVVFPEGGEHSLGPDKKKNSVNKQTNKQLKIPSFTNVSLVSLGLYSQAGGVCDLLVILGPHKLGVRGYVTGFKVQGDHALVVYVHSYLLGA